jgi:hypothetical protein
VPKGIPFKLGGKRKNTPSQNKSQNGKCSVPVGPTPYSHRAAGLLALTLKTILPSHSSRAGKGRAGQIRADRLDGHGVHFKSGNAARFSRSWIDRPAPSVRLMSRRFSKGDRHLVNGRAWKSAAQNPLLVASGLATTPQRPGAGPFKRLRLRQEVVRRLKGHFLRLACSPRPRKVIVDEQPTFHCVGPQEKTGPFRCRAVPDADSAALRQGQG